MSTGDAYSFGHLVLSHLGIVLFVDNNYFPDIFPDYATRTSLGTFSISLKNLVQTGSLQQQTECIAMI